MFKAFDIIQALETRGIPSYTLLSHRWGWVIWLIRLHHFTEGGIDLGRLDDFTWGFESF